MGAGRLASALRLGDERARSPEGGSNSDNVAILVKTGELWESIFALGSVATVKQLYSR